MDGQGQLIKRSLVNDRPITNERECACGGTVYISPSARYVTCTSGAVHCSQCGRVCRRHGKAYTCGICPGRWS